MEGSGHPLSLRLVFVSCGDDVQCLLIVNFFCDVISIDIGSFGMFRNRGIFVFLRLDFLGWVTYVVIIRVPSIFGLDLLSFNFSLFSKMSTLPWSCY